MGGEVSDHQWRDILSVLKIQREWIEIDYPRHWARELGVSELLDRALNEADE